MTGTKKKVQISEKNGLVPHPTNRLVGLCESNCIAREIKVLSSTTLSGLA